MVNFFKFWAIFVQLLSIFRAQFQHFRSTICRSLDLGMPHKTFWNSLEYLKWNFQHFEKAKYLISQFAKKGRHRNHRLQVGKTLWKCNLNIANCPIVFRWTERIIWKATWEGMHPKRISDMDNSFKSNRYFITDKIDKN